MDDAANEKRERDEAVDGEGEEKESFLTLVLTGQAIPVRMALAEDPSLADQCDPTMWTPLHHATKACQLDVIRELLKVGADIAAVTQHDSTALHIAACNAGPAQTDPKMVTALERATSLLIDRGCPPLARDNKGNTALHRAAQHGSIGIFRVLMTIIGDDGGKNAEGQTVTDRAEAAGHKAILEYIHKPVDLTGFQRFTAFKSADGEIVVKEAESAGD